MKNLQTLLGITKQELTAVAIIVGGLICGIALKIFAPQDNSHLHYSALENQIFATLDSVASQQQSTYSGVGLQGNALDTAAYNTTPEGKAEQKKSNSLPTKPINLNAATKAELMMLPGVGEKTAEKIIEYRKLQKFSSPADIMNIKGIGEKKFEKMKQYLSVGKK